MTKTKPALRTIAIVAAALFALVTPIVQALTGTIGVDESEFVREGQNTLRAAGYAFAIWTLIYAWLVGYAAYQALPSTRETPGLRMLGLPSVVAMAGCGLWLIAQSQNAKWATVAIIVLSAAVLYVPLLQRYPVQHRIEYWLVAAPLSLLAGWLTVASAINALTVLTGLGVITPQSAPAWAAGGIVLVVMAAGALTLRSKNWIYPLPVAWGLAAVSVAERMDKPMISLLAGAGALLVLVAGTWVGTHRAILLPNPRQQ
ncbi:MAG: hypothetical protein QM773_14450 [Hyphomonadaceae bacterium]